MITINEIYFLINRFHKVEVQTYYLSLQVLDSHYYADFTY